MIKNIYSTLIICALLTFGNTRAQELPMPSPSATVTQTVGLTKIEINYSRPGVKDRVIFGGLVPYDEMWRTGANKATSITFSDDVNIDGTELKAGTYALFTIPGEKEWEVIFNNNLEQWGTYSHKDEEDVLKIKIASEPAEFIESMHIYFDDLRDNSASINIHWEKTRISIPISVEVAQKAQANIEAAIKKAEQSNSTYRNAARYYLNNNLDAKQALTWAQKSVDMGKEYWNLTTLAEAKQANGLTKEAIKLAEEAKTLAVAAKSDFYIKENEKNIAAWKAKK
ncbi:MAG TPA: hypothetical protein DCX54_00860 [Flavobacteriales bacterium]|nr:hypothetical protein [Flavobacteriales bacterium]